MRKKERCRGRETCQRRVSNLTPREMLRKTKLNRRLQTRQNTSVLLYEGALTLLSRTLLSRNLLYRKLLNHTLLNQETAKPYFAKPYSAKQESGKTLFRNLLNHT